MTHTAAPAFLDTLRASGLLTPSQFEKATADLPDGPPAADALVARGHLTRFQAERLLAGRAEGFHLGSYVIQEQVGKGSMGRVYKAKHTAMNRPVAIKVLSPSVTGTDAAKAAFQREVRAAARLNHPNVVTAYDANEAGGRFYLVLEFVDGPTLDALVRARGPLPVAEACGYARQIALGLQHAHELGMVHRDLTPANVLVTRAGKGHHGGEVKITDFGIAHLGPAVSPHFAAPEPVRDPRSDLYSLGCVLHFLLTGRPPFPGARIEHLRPDTPPAVAGVIHALLAPHPQARIQTAADVAERLDMLGGREGAVSFEMPPVHPGQYSFAGSGGHAAPVVETSPWAQLTDDATLPPDIEITPVATRVCPAKRRRKTATPWVGVGVAGLVLGAAGLLAFVVRSLGK
jgi:serine/threonine protein kinase